MVGMAEDQVTDSDSSDRLTDLQHPSARAVPDTRRVADHLQAGELGQLGACADAGVVGLGEHLGRPHLNALGGLLGDHAVAACEHDTSHGDIHQRPSMC